MESNIEHLNLWPKPLRDRLLGDGNNDELGLAHAVAERLLAASGYHTRKQFQSASAVDGLARAAVDALVATISALNDDPERTALYLDLLERWLAREPVVGELSQLIDPRFDSELDLPMLAREFVALGQDPALPQNQSLMEAAIARFVAEFYEAMTRQPLVSNALTPQLVAELAARANARVASLSDFGALPASILRRVSIEAEHGAANGIALTEHSALAQGGLAISGTVLGHVVQVYQSAPGPAKLEDEDVERALVAYLRWVRNAYDKARLYGFESTPVARPTAVQKLSDIFIPVTLRRHWPPTRREAEQALSGLSGLDALVAWHSLTQSRARAGSVVAFDDMLGLSERLAIVGPAGTGKSTILAYLAAALADLGLSGEGTLLTLPDNEPLIPVLVPLRYYRDYIERIQQSAGTTLADPRAGTLAGFIPWYLRRRNPTLELSEDFFDRVLAGGGCLLMIDGLDEIANREQRGQVRQEVENLVHDIYPGNRMIVTAREAGYRDEAVFGDDFLRLDVQPMDDLQVAILVDKWCQCLFPENVAGNRDKLVQSIHQINALRNDRNLPPLISTPLMTTMVISVQWGETELPRERARLYEACVRAIIQAQYIPDDPARQQLINWGGPWEAQRDWLSELALAMHKGGRGSAAIREERVREILSTTLSREETDAFLKAVRYRGGLYEERAEFFQFIHLTFQEFLAARLLAKQRKAGRTAIKKFIADSWWREVLLLTYGYLQMDYPPAAGEFLGWLSGLRGSDELRLAGAEIAGAALLEMERPDDRQRKLQANRLARLLTDADLSVAPQLRALAGRTLAQLGDPRPGVGLDADGLPDIQWCSVEPNTDFAISKYPVTVAQFQAFVADGGYTDAWRDCWTEEGWSWKAAGDGPYPLHDNYGYANHPMVMVTYFEAAAFCRWLSARRGEQIALPTQAQWELAATRSGARAFPWGDEQPTEDHANWSDSEISSTTAVGIFPRGMTAEGIASMAGNIWEWCDVGEELLAAKVSDPGSAGEKNRAVLGGSYMDTIDAMRFGHRLMSAAKLPRSGLRFSSDQIMTDNARSTPYRYFDLRLDGVADGITVAVAGSPAGQSSSSFRTSLPAELARTELDNLSIADQVALGTELWQSLFAHPEIDGLWRASNASGSPLLRLTITDPELAALSWEQLYDPRTARFVALNGDSGLIRFTPLPIASASAPADLPLRVLFTGCSPDDLPSLDVERERKLLAEVLPSSEMTLAGGDRSGSLSQLASELMRGAAVWHFAGHGAEQALIFDDGRGKPASADAFTVGTLLAGAGVHVAVINACRAGAGGGVAASIAGALLRAGVPVVVAMQSAISDVAAVAFSQALYQSIALGHSLERATTAGRRAIFALGQSAGASWWIPALFSRSSGPTVLVTCEGIDPAANQPPAASISASHGSAISQGGLAISGKVGGSVVVVSASKS
ncbi:MAG: SUMF1/EgtB/PvdO family nonheme iron enzyme [Caldilineales bacterium]